MLTLLLAASLAVPVPKVKEVELYFPTKEGTKMVFRQRMGREIKALVQTVTKVESDKGVHTVTVETWVFGKVFTGEQVVSGDGITSKVGNEVTCSFRSAAGSKWAERVSGRGKTEFSVGEEEEVKVPAGTYKALPVVCVDESGIKVTTWYVKGMGPVKTEIDGEVVSELKEFTPGK